MMRTTEEVQRSECKYDESALVSGVEDPILRELVGELREGSPARGYRASARIGGPSPQFVANAQRMQGMAVVQAGLRANAAMRNVGHIATPLLASATDPSKDG